MSWMMIASGIAAFVAGVFSGVVVYITCVYITHAWKQEGLE